MASTVKFKFKSAREYDTVSFPGTGIKLLDLKRAIVEQKKLHQGMEFDLNIVNDKTKEGACPSCACDCRRGRGRGTLSGGIPWQPRRTSYFCVFSWIKTSMRSLTATVFFLFFRAFSKFMPRKLRRIFVLKIVDPYRNQCNGKSGKHSRLEICILYTEIIVKNILPKIVVSK